MPVLSDVKGVIIAPCIDVDVVTANSVVRGAVIAVFMDFTPHASQLWVHLMYS